MFFFQAAHLLQAPKSNPEDISNISSTCFKLNSLQLRALLEKYQTVPDEPPIPHDLLVNVIKVGFCVHIDKCDFRHIL